ncbi:hypothetical protein YC2023_116446 [Brassica napus]
MGFRLSQAIVQLAHLHAVPSHTFERLQALKKFKCFMCLIEGTGLSPRYKNLGLCCFEIADGYENQAPQRFQGKFQAKVTCCILGIGCLASWNNMLTIADYYYHVFPDYHPSRVLTVVYQPFALGTIVILAYHESKINTRKRNLIGYIIFTISTHSLLVWVQLALTSAFRLMTKAAFENSNDGLRKGASDDIFSDLSIDTVSLMLYAYVFPKLPIVNYYRRKVASEGSKTVNADLAAAGIQNQSYSTDDVSNNQRLSNKELLVQNIDYAVNLTLIYLISLSIFPGFLYENTGQHGLGSWYALVLVAMYNCGNMVGRYTPLVEWLKIENRKGLTLAYGDQGWMIMLVSLLGLTTGHFNVCILITAPKGYNGPEKNALGNLLVVFLIGGIVAGTSLGWLWLIENKTAERNDKQTITHGTRDVEDSILFIYVSNYITLTNVLKVARL